jgi:hypothetical protein
MRLAKKLGGLFQAVRSSLNQPPGAIDIFSTNFCAAAHFSLPLFRDHYLAIVIR